MKNPIAKTLLVGLVGGLTLNFVMVLTFRLIGFGWHGGGKRFSTASGGRGSERELIPEKKVVR